jgi:hypothetical protein
VLRPLQHRGKGDVERQRLRLQLAAGLIGLGDPLLAKIGVLLAGEEILQVPFALAVTHQHEKTIAHSFSFRFDSRCRLKIVESEHIGH